MGLRAGSREYLLLPRGGRHCNASVWASPDLTEELRETARKGLLRKVEGGPHGKLEPTSAQLHPTPCTEQGTDGRLRASGTEK